MLLWSGQLVSWIGTEVSNIALPLIVLALTGSPAQAGGVAAIRGLVYVFWAIPAGIIIDRWDRKLVMIAANLGSGLAMGSIALGLALNSLSLVQLYIASGVEGSFFVFANLGRFAAFPKVVSKEQYPAAAAQSGTADQIALLVGPPLGGFLYQTAGGFLAVLVDSFSYFVNAFSILFIHKNLNPETYTAPKAIHHEVKEAFLWLWRQKLLRFLNLLTAGRTILSAGLYLLLIVLAKENQASSVFIGLIFSAGAVGGILGSLVSARLHRRFEMRQLVVAISFFSFLIFSLYTVAANNFLLAAVTALFYAVDPLYIVTVSSYSVQTVPDEIRGRIVGLTRLVTLAANSFGFFITGYLLQYLGSKWTVGVFSALLFGLFLASMLNKNLARSGELGQF